MPQDLNKITEKIIGCAYTVGRTLGSGFLEKVYENALSHELSKAGLAVRTQWPIRVFYDKATGLKVCLLINFGGSSVEVKRIVHNL